MVVFTNFTKLFLFPIYYLIHHNIIFGFFQKFVIKIFYYKKFKFKLQKLGIPLSHYPSFLFNTYEYNDRKLVENYLSENNRCIIIGGGLGFIPVLAYHKTKNKILVSEINKKIIPNLKSNLELNNCKFALLNKNFKIGKFKNKFEKFFYSNSFIGTSKYIKTDKEFKVSNMNINKVKNFSNFNTLIIDGEGIEEYFIKNLSKLKSIKEIIFELHYNIFDKLESQNLMLILEKNGFKKIDSCFNSFYFKKD